jgi:hypothetical protein
MDRLVKVVSIDEAFEKAKPYSRFKGGKFERVKGYAGKLGGPFLHLAKERVKVGGLNAEAVQKFNSEVKAPHVHTQYSTLGGEQNAAIILTISLQNKRNWNNNILQNSPYSMFHLSSNGTLEQFSKGHNVSKFRKTKVKDVNEAIAKVNTFIDQQVTFYDPPTGPASPPKIKIYDSSDFKVETEVEHPDFEDEEGGGGVRSIAVVDYSIDPGSRGGRYEPPSNPTVEDVVYVWAEGPKKGQELSRQEQKKYLEKNNYRDQSYLGLLDDLIIQHQEDLNEGIRAMRYEKY